MGPIGEGGRSAGQAMSLDNLFSSVGTTPSVQFAFESTPQAVVGWGVSRPAGSYYLFTGHAGDTVQLDYVVRGDSASLHFTLSDADGVMVDDTFYGSVILPHDGLYIVNAAFVDSNVWGTEKVDFTLSLTSGDVLTRNMLYGGTGNDTYVVYESTDQVVENAGAGVDTVQSYVSHRLSANVENLVLLGSNSIDGTGNALANQITGNSGGNTLIGGAGADILNGGGAGGGDWLYGGADNDTYYVWKTGDRVVEYSNDGVDVVQSSISYKLGPNVENLTLLGMAPLIGTGNGLANVLTGNSLGNSLNGKAGADTMIGGDGSDTYSVDNAGDQAIESSYGGGVDKVNSTVSFTLGTYVEKLTLIGTAGINGTGNSGNNVLSGNDAANTLRGLGGNDRLVGGGGNDQLYGGFGIDRFTGGAGADKFVFDSQYAGTTDNTITDFSVADDTIVLDRSVFTAFTTDGTLAAGSFVVDGPAHDSNDRILYFSAYGSIYYDIDGNGPSQPSYIGRVDGGLALTHADFLIVG